MLIKIFSFLHASFHAAHQGTSDNVGWSKVISVPKVTHTIEFEFL